MSWKRWRASCAASNASDEHDVGRRRWWSAATYKTVAALIASLLIPIAAIALAQSGAAGESAASASDYAVLSDFVKSSDGSAPDAGGSVAPNDSYHAALQRSLHAQMAGTASSLADDYSTLREFAHGKAAAQTNVLVASTSPLIEVMQNLRLPQANPHALRDAKFGAAEAAPVTAPEPSFVVAQASSVSPKPKRTEAPGSSIVMEGGYARGDPQICLSCHAKNTHVNGHLIGSPMAVKGDQRTPMAGGGCEACHGPSAPHVLAARANKDWKVGDPGEPAIVFKGPAASPVEDRNAVCQGCHRGGMLINWVGSAHEKRIACVDCHSIMDKDDKVRVRKTQAEVCFGCHAEQRADSYKYSHHPIREGKVVCSDCHNPMGGQGPKLLKEMTVNQTCYNCHPEKRGPMLFEHQPVREACTNCHTPHGSAEPRLWKETIGFLCSGCHTAFDNSMGGAVGGNSAIPGHSGATFIAQLGNQRLCLNCHSQIHGSNSANGAYFFR